MRFHRFGGIHYFSFENLDECGVLNATFTRKGGLSPSPWSSLNVGGLRGDDHARVLNNRVLAFHSVGRAPDSVYDAWQVHGNEVICTTAPRPIDIPHKKADAIFTDRPEVTLFMRFADCVPILLYDPNRKVIGLVHAGWQGTISQVVTRSLDVMTAHYGSNLANVKAAIGPSICPEHYQVGMDIVNKARQVFGDDAPSLLPMYNSNCHFNLWEANRLLLERKGVRDVSVSKICTACNLEDWYSHRAENGHTGRFGVLMALSI